MAHFAQIDGNNLVTQVLTAEQDFIKSGMAGDPAMWVQTSYNVYGNVYSGQDSKQGNAQDIAARARKNYAGIGYTYDPVLDMFYGPQPFVGWILNTTTGLWQPPI